MYVEKWTGHIKKDTLTVLALFYIEAEYVYSHHACTRNLYSRPHSNVKNNKIVKEKWAIYLEFVRHCWKLILRHAAPIFASTATQYWVTGTAYALKMIMFFPKRWTVVRYDTANCFRIAAILARNIRPKSHEISFMNKIILWDLYDFDLDSKSRLLDRKIIL